MNTGIWTFVGCQQLRDKRGCSIVTTTYTHSKDKRGENSDTHSESQQNSEGLTQIVEENSENTNTKDATETEKKINVKKETESREELTDRRTTQGKHSADWLKQSPIFNKHRFKIKTKQKPSKFEDDIKWLVCWTKYVESTLWINTSYSVSSSLT